MLKRIDGFNDNTDITRRWDASGTVVISGAYARSGDGGVQCSDEDSYFEDSTFSADSFIAGFGMRFSGTPSLDSSKPFFVAMSGSSPLISLALDASNYIKAYGSSGQLLGTSSNTLPDNQWKYLEVAGFSAATGTVIVHVNDVEEINASGLIGSGTIPALRWAGINSSIPSQYDDLYIQSPSGTFYNNSVVTTVSYSTGTTALGVSGTTPWGAVTDGDDNTFVYGYSGTDLYTPSNWPALSIDYHGIEARVRGYGISGPFTAIGFMDSGSYYHSLVVEDTTTSTVETRTILDTKPSGEAWGDGDSVYSYGIAIQTNPSSPILYTPNLLFWLDASDAATMFTDTAGTTPVTQSGDIVARWNSKDGSGKYYSNATVGERPSYREDVKNSLSIIRSLNSRLTSSNFLASASDYTFFIAAKIVDVASYSHILDCQTGRLAVGTKGTVLQVYDGADRNSSFTIDDQWHILCYRLQTTSPIVRVDGVSYSLSGYTQRAYNGTVSVFAYYGSLISPFNSDSGEFICYSSALIDAQIKEIELHLASKWGVVYRG